MNYLFFTFCFVLLSSFSIIKKAEEREPASSNAFDVQLVGRYMGVSMKDLIERRNVVHAVLNLHKQGIWDCMGRYQLPINNLIANFKLDQSGRVIEDINPDRKRKISPALIFHNYFLLNGEINNLEVYKNYQNLSTCIWKEIKAAKFGVNPNVIEVEVFFN